MVETILSSAHWLYIVAAAVAGVVSVVRALL